MTRGSKLILLLLSVLMLGSWKQQVNEWVYEREKKGIKIFTKKSKWGKLRDSRAVMMVSSTPEEMLRLLSDFNSYPTWVSRCKSARVVARLNDNEFIAHLVFDAPWPVADRDCVLRIRVDKNPTTGVIVITETSEPKYIKEEEGVVRIQQMVSTWKLVPKTGGTEVTNEYSSNPGGNIPDWMTNSQSVETPMSTFENLQEKATSHR